MGCRRVAQQVALCAQAPAQPVDQQESSDEYHRWDAEDDEPAAVPVQGLLVNFLKPLEGLLVEVVQEPKSKS